MRGFKGFRKPDFHGDDSALNERISRLNIRNRFIYWTGEDYTAGRSLSLRSNSLKCLKVAKVPVPLEEWIRLAARAVSPELGYDPAAVRAGLYLHRESKPAVYYELERKDDGSYVSVYSHSRINPPIKAGDVIIEAEKKEEPAQIEVSGQDLVETQTSKTKRATRAAARTKGKAKVA
jgi:hypothetical protein